MNIRFVCIVKILCFFLILNTCLSQVKAQSETPEKKWHFLAELYLMFPNMQGETGIGSSLTVPVDANTGAIFSNLKMGAMLYGEARTDKWAISSDWVYMKLDQDITPGRLINSGTVGVQQSVWEVAGLYRILPFWEAGVGGRLNYLQTSIDARRNVLPASTEEVSGKHDATWFDPILIIRLSADIKDKWLFQARGDLGGFGVGSDFTWQLQGYVGYRFTKLFQLTAGYRILSTDYDKEVGYNEFVFNMNEFGPVIRLGFNF
jgi:hypothetical protein